MGTWLHLCSRDERREAKVAPTYCVGEPGELAPKFRASQRAARRLGSYAGGCFAGVLA